MRKVSVLLVSLAFYLGGGVLSQEQANAPDIWAAAGQGDLGTLKALVKEGADVNEFHPSFYFTPLITAILGYQGEVVKWLLKNGAKVDAQNPTNGATALHVAVFLGDVAITQSLLNADADVLAKNYEGATSLDLAQLDWSTTSRIADSFELQLDEQRVMDGRKKVRKLLEQSLQKRATSEFDVALYLGDASAVAKHLKDGTDPNTLIDQEGTTPLVYATAFNHKQIVQSLLDAGANVNAQSGSGGSTALHAAVFAGRSDIARLLIDAGADPEGPDYAGSIAADAVLLDWPTTAYLAAVIGIELNEAEVREGRSNILQLLRNIETQVLEGQD